MLSLHITNIILLLLAGSSFACYRKCNKDFAQYCKSNGVPQQYVNGTTDEFDCTFIDGPNKTSTLIPANKKVFDGNLETVEIMSSKLLNVVDDKDNYDVFTGADKNLKGVVVGNCKPPKYIFTVITYEASSTAKEGVVLVTNNDNNSVGFNCTDRCNEINLEKTLVDTLQDHRRGLTKCCVWSEFIAKIKNPSTALKKHSFENLYKFKSANNAFTINPEITSNAIE